MHSSTSSSNRRAPAGPWGRTWTLSLILTVVALGGLEAFWRWQGHKTSIVDDMQWWAHHRDRVYDDEGRAIVLLGASRIQLDIATEVLRRLFPDYKIVQLAVDGRRPVAVLRNLAQDEDFSGIVVCALTAPGLLRNARNDQQEYVDYYQHGRSLNGEINRLILSFIQQRLVCVNPQVNLKNALTRYAITRKFPKPLYMTTQFDRSRSADYSMMDLDKHLRFRIDRLRDYYEANPPPSPDQWLMEAVEIEKYVQSIHRRGGKVVFVRFPTSGEHLDLDRREYPRELYWDRFAAMTNAITFHFQDSPATARLNCPDGSHLDYRDKARFTEKLVEELSRRGMFGPVLASQQQSPEIH